MRIPEEILQNIFNTVNIRQIIGESVSLKKRGRNWVGLCPFHADKDPSFSVNDEKQLFYCFGCGEGGDIFKFMMKFHGLTFLEAVKELASRYGIDIPERPVSNEQQRRRDERERLIRINQRAADYFHSMLLSGNGIAARNYLSERGVPDDMIKHFHLGWSENVWDGLLQWFENLNVPPELLENAGLVISRKDGKGWYDRFRGRIIFPIHDRHGNVVAFGGRILPDKKNDIDNQPKYLNSPETLIYNKSSELYGFHLNRSEIRRTGYGFVVEGYMDMLSLYTAGVHNVVATLGTAITDTHVRFLKGLCNEWFVFFDGDNAGRKAAFRALSSFYRHDLRVRVVTLDKEDDPDTFIQREGKDALALLTDNAPSGIDFVIKRGQELYGSDPDGMMQTVEDVITLLDVVNDPVRKNLLAADFARKSGIREDVLWERIRKRPIFSSRFENSKSVEHDNSADGEKDRVSRKITNSAETKLIGFIIGYPDSIKFFIDSGIDIWLENSLLRDLWNAIIHVYNMRGELSVPVLMEHLADMPDLKGTVATLTRDFPPCSDEERDETLAGLVSYTQKRHKKALRMKLLEEMKESDSESIDELALLKRLQELR